MNEYFRTFLEIDLKKLKNNYRELKKLVQDETIVAPVIKADGYGHGSVQIAKALSDEGANFFVVATVLEAIELREAGIKGDILVLGYVNETMYHFLYEYDIDVTLLYFEQLNIIKKFDEKYDKKLKVHINIDTGMKRLGFDVSDESVFFLNDIADNKVLDVRGIYTHFATADEQNREVVDLQKRKFEQFLSKLHFKNIFVHMANSAAILCLPDTYKSIVRAGIATYGLYPSQYTNDGSVNLQPILSWYSHIIAVRELKAGDGVSYGWEFVADRDMKIATVSIGYADGYSRSLSNKGYMIVGGKRAKILGRVCMDLTVIDVTEIDVNIDDRVTLIGRDGDEEITTDDIANIAHTINYEVCCNVSKRVKRIYV